MIESGFFAVERGKDMLVLGDPRLQLAFGSTVFQLLLLGGELSQQAFDEFLRPRGGGA